jgi:hypothetical protein
MDAQARKKMAHQAKTTFMQRFTVEAMADSLLAAFKTRARTSVSAMTQKQES